MLVTVTHKQNIQTKPKTQVSSIKFPRNTLNSYLIHYFQIIKKSKSFQAHLVSLVQSCFLHCMRLIQGKFRLISFMNHVVKLLYKRVAN